MYPTSLKTRQMTRLFESSKLKRVLPPAKLSCMKVKDPAKLESLLKCLHWAYESPLHLGIEEDWSILARPP